MAAKFIYKTTITACYSGCSEAEITITAENREEAEELLRQACSRSDPYALEALDEAFSASSLEADTFDMDLDELEFGRVEEIGPAGDADPSELPVRYRDAPGQIFLFGGRPS